MLWSALPGARIPLSGDETASQADDEAWARGRDRLIAQLKQNPNPEIARAVHALEQLRRDDFLDQYLLALEAGARMPLSGTSVAVGHVAIVDRALNGDLSVIEADPRVTPWWRVAMERHSNGVREHPYSKWIDFHDRSSVWHGRMRGVTPAQGRQIAAQARLFVGRDYDFFNLNLADHSGFYCSKLVWVAIWTSIGVAIDGDARLDRSFWLSPKRLQSLPTVAKLHEPGVYGEP